MSDDIDASVKAAINAYFGEDCWDSLPESEFDRWLAAIKQAASPPPMTPDIREKAERLATVYRLTKCSEPGWDQDFATMDELVDELRKHICPVCRYTGIDGDPPVDIGPDGKVVECRDTDVLLGTSCGLEYFVEEIGSHD